jgi:nicotinate-nucleotide adenylyltransferase
MGTSARSVGVLGGMFDPPHIGHLILAREAAWQLALDEVRLVVCARPPHRPDPHVSAKNRLAMVRAAVTGHPPLVASSAEIDRPGPSYTVDTLDGFISEDSEIHTWLIIGADQLLGFRSWREPDRILAMTRLAVVARAGADTHAVGEAAEAFAPDRFDVISMPAIGLSSTLIRDRVAHGQPVDHLLPLGVGDLIARRGLYRQQTALP